MKAMKRNLAGILNAEFSGGARAPAVVALALLCLAFGSRRAMAADGTWTVVGTNSWAAAQSTANGKILGALQGWDGKLYSGYGDYGANTGPVRLMAFDPATGAFTNEFTFQTEAVYVFRPLFGRLYVPPIDPRYQSGIAVRKFDKGWEFQSVWMEHAFDIATLTGGDLWLVGSYGDHVSKAMRSVDDGVTWRTGRNEVYLNDDYSRFYFAATLNGKLYLQSSSTNACSVFDGTTWQSGPNISNYGSLAREFAGSIVLLSRHITADDTGDFLTFTGTRPPSTALSAIYNYTVSGGALYTIGADRVVRSTTNLKKWNVLASNAPVGSRSIAVLDNKLYVGTTASEIQVYSVPVGTRPVVWVVPTLDRAQECNAVPGSFTVRRSVAASTALAVKFSFSGTAAGAGVDYVASAASSITIPAGADAATVSIVPVEDLLVEGTEFVSLTLTPDAAYSIETPSDARILVEDARVLSLEPVAQSVAENAGAASIAVRMSAPLDEPVSVGFTLGGTAASGGDFLAPTSPLVIPAGSTNALLSISLLDDMLPEPDKTIVVTLVEPANAILNPAAAVHTLTLVDDDWLPILANVSATNVTSTTAELIGDLVSSAASPASLSVYWGLAEVLRHDMGGGRR